MVPQRETYRRVSNRDWFARHTPKEIRAQVGQLLYVVYP
jgi:hypothetical protein